MSSDTGIPIPVVVVWACRADSPAIERLAHDRLAWCRENTHREFFRCDVATAVRAIEACYVPLGPRYRPQRRPERVGKGRRPLIPPEMLYAALRATCGALLRHPVALCLVIGLLVTVYLPDIPAWVPRGAVVRAALALVHMR